MLLVICAIGLFSCSSEKEPSAGTHVFNTTVSSSLNNFKQSFNSKKTELQFDSGIKVDNCNTYSKEVKKSRVTEDVNNQAVKSEYLLCDVLELLRNKSFLEMKSNADINNVIANKLDLRTFPSSFGPRLDDKNYTIKSIAGADLIVKSNNVTYETADWNFKLELIATTDINSNKKYDWIIWVVDESKTGNYRAYQTVILYDVDDSMSRISATAYN